MSRNPQSRIPLNPTARFTDRVENYIKYRPGYPPALLSYLWDKCDLTPDSAIADIGSGTGIFSELLLKRGNAVYGIEPNAEMRAAAERLLSRYSRFHSVNGSAESTTLPAHSLNLITCAQAFHWFDRETTRQEFRRILKPGCRVALIWNDRRTTSSPFMRAYEFFVQEHGTDYVLVDHKKIDAPVLSAFFGHTGFETAVFENRHRLDYPGLKGRLLSSSYVPAEGQTGYEAMLDASLSLFDDYKVDGFVEFEYDTRIFLGELD